MGNLYARINYRQIASDLKQAVHFIEKVRAELDKGMLTDDIEEFKQIKNNPHKKDHGCWP